MRTRIKLLLAGLTATFLLSLAVASASANKLSLSNRNFKASWTSLEVVTLLGTLKCPITMEGSFHYGTIAKVEEALVGHVSTATAASASCTSGKATVNQEALPWHIRYGGFTGTLPNITGVLLRLIGAKFTVETSALTCTWQTTAAHPAVAIANLETGRNKGKITGLRMDENTTIPLRSDSFCAIPGEGLLRGTGEVTLLGATTAITVTLIPLF